MPKITAFVARSFNQEDEPKIEPIFSYLGSFKKAGFFVETAQPADVESVSKKVRDMIDASDVFVGIFTRRWPLYENGVSLGEAIRLALGLSKVDRWGAPPWVIQESGYALKAIAAKQESGYPLKAIAAKQKMILFREKGVELPSLQGDLEYIEFDAKNFAPAFQKASEMINGLLQEASGTVIETIVRSNPPAVEADAEKSPSQLEEPAKQPTGLGHYFIEMREAIDAKEWQKAERAYEDGLKLLEREEPKVDVLWWKAMYHRLRYSAGQPDGIKALRTLAEENPSSPEPLASLSICFYHFQEYEESAEFALKAARLASEGEAIDNLVYAAKALRKANKPQDALKVLLDACKAPTPHEASNLSLRKELYALLKDFKDSYVAFAVGEWTLHENPGAGDFRFSLAFDYEDKNVDDLGLFHYRILRDNDPKDASVLNNIGAASARLNLPILAVDSYAGAYKNGNTLAADNLAHLYLNGGFTSDAAALVKGAMKLENHEPKLPGTLAAIDENRKKEEQREKSFLEEAEKHRRFLLKLGESYFQVTPALDGTWKFPDTGIPLNLTAGALSGETQVTVNLPPSSLNLLFGSPRETRQETRKILFTGKVEGRTCKFRLETETVSSGALGSAIGSSQPVREGYIAFSADGTSGEVCVLKDGKPSEFYSISKAAVA
jgi:hypothetical protein